MRWWWTAALVAAAGWAAAGCATAGGSTDAAAEREVRDAVAGYLARLKARPVDVDSLAAWYDSTAEVFLPGTVPLEGAERVRLYLESYRDVTVEKVDFRIDTVEVHGRDAYVWGFFSESLRATDSLRTTRGRSVFVWVKGASGRWRIRRIMTQPV